jgi:hypothetical protein
MICKIDLTPDHLIEKEEYETINEFIVEKINGFKKNYIAKSKDFSFLNNFRGVYGLYTPNLVKLFESKQSMREKILASYGIDLSLINLSDSEFLKKINDTDSGILYNNALSLMIITLMGTSDSMKNVLLMKNQYDKNKARIKESTDDITFVKNPCGKYKSIAKQYIEYDELEDDNNTTIYFDKKYDTTYYDIANEYKFESSMSTEERITLLTKKLMEKNGLSQNDARRDAQAMINGRRLVEDGDYAILEMKDPDENVDFKYYLRVNEKWTEDDSISRNIMTESSKMFCNLNEKCIQIKGDCHTIEGKGVGEVALKNNNLKQILDDVDPYLDIYKMAKNELISEEERDFYDTLEANLKNTYDNIKNDFDNAEFRIGKLISSKLMHLFKYEEQKFRIGATAEENITEISPYLKLRDIILGQGDFVKRQLDIIKFVNFFTHEAMSEESLYWYYCNTTNTKLMPSFLVKMANAFIKNENFSKVVENICTDQGTISDDGNRWVDKYSGYTIRSIDLSGEEEFTEEGFKAKTRSVMETDLGESIIQLNKTQKKFESPEAEKVSNIVSAMAGFMGITIEAQKEFILRNVIEQQGSSMPSKEMYDKAMAVAVAKGRKNLDNYETAYNASLVILSLCYYLIAIQISIPSVKTRKTFPGCIRSFVGFPMNGAEDLSAITYVACVANKIKSSVNPWDSIKKMKVSDIVKKMEATITKFILQNKNIQENIKEKQIYLQLNAVDLIPDEHSINRWINFLPPLYPVKLTATDLQDVTDGFQKEFMDALRKGSPNQHEMFNIIRSKMIFFSQGIVELIQKTIHKKAAIMTNSTGEPYLENGCCDDGETKTLKYFINAEPDIVTYNNKVVKLSNIIDDIIQMQKGGIFFDPVDTKFKFPLIKDEFSEDVIYKAFIVFCKYGSSTPISDELRSICIEKPENFNENAPLSDNIRKLKSDGKNYSLESFEQLLNIVNNNNLVKLNIHKNAVSNIKVLQDLLASMDERDVNTPPKVFRDHFSKIINNFERGTLFEDTIEMRNFKNYLSKANETMMRDIKEFIGKFTRIDSSELKNFTECMEQIDVFQETGDGLFIEREDETIYKMIVFIKNSLRNLTREFPNIIINNDVKSVSMPEHWNLSQRHNSDLSEIIKKHYALLHKYYHDSDIKLVMQKIKRVTRDTELLAKHTLFFAPMQVGPDKYIYSVFDRRLSIMLFKFYFYSVFTDIISFKDDDEILLKMQTSSVDELEIIRGNKIEFADKIANVLVTFVDILCNDKKVIDYNYKSLMERILRSKEKEKDVITKYLKDMSDEEREIENIFKNNKLEKWSKGLQKGLVTYDKDTYDDERDAMEKQALSETALGKKRGITDMNRDILIFDENQENDDAENIELEETRINYMGEDAEPEEDGFDGDEEF